MGEKEIIAQIPLSRDDQVFQKLVQNFTKLSKYIKKDLNKNKNTASLFQKNFNKDTVFTWMQNPRKFEKKLRGLSRFLYDESLHYKRICQYFANFNTYDYVVDLKGIADFSKLDEETVTKKYLETLNFIDVMNIKHEFAKAEEIAWRDDVFFGYEWRAKDSYYIQQLDADYCDITAFEDGVPVVSFDFSYFDKYKDALERFDTEFERKYNIYKANKQNQRWQELDSYKTIAIKINEGLDYFLPPLAGIFFEITDIYDYKELKKARTALENYLLLVFKIPYLAKGEKENDFALGIDQALEYFDMAMSALPEEVGGMISPFESAEAIKVDRTDKSTDMVIDAENALYNAAGVPKNAFNSTDNSASTLLMSIKQDSKCAFRVLRQFERHINKKLKDFNKTVYFKIEFLNITEENRQDKVNMYKEGATLSTPTKTRLCAAMGMTPMDVISSNFIEQKILKINEEWIPLTSSHTQSGDGGRPQKEETELTPSGETTRKQGSNDKGNKV